MQGASKKKATAEDVQKMAKGLMMNHDSVGGHASMSLETAAVRLNSNADLQGVEAALADVAALREETDGEDEAEDEADEKTDNDDDDDNEDEGRRKGGKKPKKGTWFDRDRQVNRAQKALLGQHDKLLASAKDEVSTAAALRKDVQQLSAKDKKLVEGDLLILTRRELCLCATLEGERELRSVLASYDDSGLPSAASAASDPLKGLGKAPPTRTFRDLKPFSVWKEEIDAVLDCQSNDDIEKITGDCRGPLADLVGATKSACKDLSRALQAIKKAASQKPPEQKAAKRMKTAVAATSAHSLFQLWDQLPTAPTCDEGNDVNVSGVSIIKCQPERQANFDGLACVKTQIFSDFLQVFNTQSVAQKQDRGHKRFQGELQTAMCTRMAAIMRETALVQPEGAEPLAQQLKQALEVQAVIVGKNSTKATSEKHFVGPLLCNLWVMRCCFHDFFGCMLFCALFCRSCALDPQRCT